jgi:hypothetical protein
MVLYLQLLRELSWLCHQQSWQQDSPAARHWQAQLLVAMQAANCARLMNCKAFDLRGKLRHTGAYGNRRCICRPLQMSALP